MKLEFIADNDDECVVTFESSLDYKGHTMDISVYDGRLGSNQPDICGLEIVDVKRLISFLQDYLKEVA